MPLNGIYAWKEHGIPPEERIDRFFNLIDHAVESGIALNELYSRKHLKEFLLYALHEYEDSHSNYSLLNVKGTPMPKLTLTNTNASSVVVGDPSFLTVTVNPKETKTLEITDAQLQQLVPHLEKLAGAKWIKYTIANGTSPTPTITPAKTEIVPLAVDTVIKVDQTLVPANPLSPAPEEPKASSEGASKDPEPDAQPPPSAPKPPSFDRKNRNR